MKRKLISFEAFEELNKNSLTHAENELLEAAPVLAKALEVDDLELQSFDAETVMFEANDGTFIKANYSLDKNYINLDEVEQIVLDTETERSASRDRISKLVDALLEDNKEKADSLFNEYMSLPVTKRTLKESITPVIGVSKGTGRKSKFRGKHRAGGRAAAMKAARTRAKNDRMTSPSLKKKIEADRKAAKQKLGGKHQQAKKGQRSVRIYIRRKVGGKKMHEWANLAHNVTQYCEYRELGPILNESSIQTDDQGNVNVVRIPTSHMRNEAKLLSFNWKTLATDVKVLRSGAKKLAENSQFCKAISDLKRSNAMSDNTALEEALENIVTNYSDVIYLTQNELAETIKTALESVNASNFDDQTCTFMAEGILRTAQNAYIDRVDKIMKLAGVEVDAEVEDKYPQFQETVADYYTHLDESLATEMQVFVDLYEALRNVYSIAQNENDEIISIETASHLNELYAIVSGNVEANTQVAEAAAEWLNYLMEGDEGSEDWAVSNEPYITDNGDNPVLFKKGKNPGIFPDPNKWGSSAPVSGGNGFSKELSDESRYDGFANIDSGYEKGNPYLLKPFGDYKMKGEKFIDDDNGITYQGGDETWPNLKNPFIKSGETPQNFKMNNGKEADLVVDK